MSAQNSVLVVGSIALDDVETPFGKRENAIGGAAIFFGIAASYFTHIRIVGVAGEDFPEATLEMLKSRNIDTSGIEIADGKTFRWGGKYHEDINCRDTLYTHLNVFADFKPKIPKSFENTPYIFLGNIQPQLQLDVLKQIKNPKFIALDTMNLWIHTTREDLLKVMQKVDLVLINDSELRELTDELNLLKGLDKLHQMGPKIAVIKKGEHGAYLSYARQLFYCPVYPVYQPTDPTGAGDSFAGGFMGYLAASNRIDFRTLKKATIYGAIMGSFLVEHFSVDGLLNLKKEDIDQRYKAIRAMAML